MKENSTLNWRSMSTKISIKSYKCFTLKYVPKMDSFINYNQNHNKMIDQFVTIMSIISAIKVMFFCISSESYHTQHKSAFYYDYHHDIQASRVSVSFVGRCALWDRK